VAAKRGWPRLGVFVAATSATLVIGAWIFLTFEPLKHEAIAFEVAGECNASAPRDATVASSWNQDIFVIRAAEYPNCVEATKAVSAQIIGNQILLRITYHSPSGTYVACRCEKVTLVRLSELPRRDYVVTRIGWP